MPALDLGGWTAVVHPLIAVIDVGTATIVAAAVSIVPSAILVRLKRQNTLQHRAGRDLTLNLTTLVTNHDTRLTRVESKVDDVPAVTARLVAQTAAEIAAELARTTASH